MFAPEWPAELVRFPFLSNGCTFPLYSDVSSDAGKAGRPRRGRQGGGYMDRLRNSGSLLMRANIAKFPWRYCIPWPRTPRVAARARAGLGFDSDRAMRPQSIRGVSSGETRPCHILNAVRELKSYSAGTPANHLPRARGPKGARRRCKSSHEAVSRAWSSAWKRPMWRSARRLLPTALGVGTFAALRRRGSTAFFRKVRDAEFCFASESMPLRRGRAGRRKGAASKTRTLATLRRGARRRSFDRESGSRSRWPSTRGLALCERDKRGAIPPRYSHIVTGQPTAYIRSTAASTSEAPSAPYCT